MIELPVWALILCAAVAGYGVGYRAGLCRHSRFRFGKSHTSY